MCSMINNTVVKNTFIVSNKNNKSEKRSNPFLRKLVFLHSTESRLKESNIFIFEYTSERTVRHQNNNAILYF